MNLPLRTFQQILTEPIPPPEWLIEPLLPRDGRTVVYGEFGGLKSWVLLHLGLHVAAGRDWLGQFPIPHPRSVLYIDEEMDAAQLETRVKRLAAGMGSLPPGLPFRTLSRASIRLTEQGARLLLAQLDTAKFIPDVIIIETLRRVLVGDEKEAVDMAAFWRAVEPIMQRGICFIVSHHMRKPQAEGDNDLRNRASGSTDIIAGADCAWAVIREKNQATLTCTKIRQAGEPDPIIVEFDFGPHKGIGPVTAYIGSGSTKADDQGGLTMLTIIAFLRANGEAETAQLWAVCQGKNISRRTFERVLAKLVEEKQIIRVVSGMYSINPPPLPESPTS